MIGSVEFALAMVGIAMAIGAALRIGVDTTPERRVQARDACRDTDAIACMASVYVCDGVVWSRRVALGVFDR